MSVASAPSAAIRFSVNGEAIELDAPGGLRLLDVLRRDLGLTGTKEGCGEGECGACSVLVDGEVVLSCLVPVVQAAGCDVRTVEGLAVGGGLEPLQEAFLGTGGAQCGICTPGMLMAARAFLDSGAAPTDDAIREAIAGNLCRCTGYTKIVEAIALASRAEAPGRRIDPARGSARRVSVGPNGTTVLAARTLDEAIGLIAERGARPMAGGTDVMVGLAAGAFPAGREFVDIRGLDELRGIAREGDELVLGALTTYAELRRSSIVAVALPILAEAAALIGAVQIQNRGTIGGNIANASPAGDTLPILLATDASIELAGPRGARRVPASGFWLAYRRTERAADELVTRVRIPLVPGRQVRFRKVAGRRAQAISKVVAAVAWCPSATGAGAWSDVRVALGSVAEVPLRAPHAEAVLEGSSPSVDVADRLATAVQGDIRPIDDVRSTADYRRLVSGRILRRIVLDEVGPG